MYYRTEQLAKVLLNSTCNKSLEEQRKFMGIFLAFLKRKKISGVLPGIKECYMKMLEKKEKMMLVRVLTKYPLSDKMKKEVGEVLKKMRSGLNQIIWKESEYPLILGGIKLFCGYKMLDLTVDYQIESLRKRLIKN